MITGQKCYRVLVVDAHMNRWTPIIKAKDEMGITAKVENIYPGGAVLDCYVVHERHDQWDILFPEGSLVGAISGDPSPPIERRRA